MIRRFFKCFTMPTLSDLIKREQAETARDLLRAQSTMEDWQSQVAKLEKRLLRLEILAAGKQS